MAIITRVKERINQLNQAGFQILCDAFLVREGYPNIVALGTKDGEEKTTPGTPDTYFCLSDGKYVFAEYTTQKNGLIAKIRSDINKCLEEGSTKIPLCDIVEIVYCHTSSNIPPADDHALKSYCEDKGIKLTIIGIDSLAEKLKNYPSIIKDHLGLTVDSGQIQSSDDFVKQYDSNAMAATLETTFLFREKEIESINTSFDSVNTVLLVGPAGIGKTRLALEYANLHAKIHNEKLLCIHDRSLPIYEDLKLYFEKPGKYFIFVDDANQLSNLEHIIEYDNRADDGYHVHILMTVRDYAVSKVQSKINGIVKYEIVTIASFTDNEISSLMKKHYGIQNPFYLERIIQIAEGNARIAMLAGKLACEANRLDAINDVSELYVDYYGRALKESGVESNCKLLFTAGILAFLNSIHLDHIDPIMPMLEEKGLSKKDFVENAHLLHNHEIVDVYYDKGIRFSDQCMANFVLKYVFYDKKTIKLSTMIEVCFDLYRERTVNAVNTLLSVFRNDELHDFVKKEIRELWENLESENSPMFIDYMKVFYPLNELKTLMIIQNQIDNQIPVILKVNEINPGERKNFQTINDDIITILGGFSYSEYLDEALDLFFQYYLKRPDLYMEFYLASTSFFSIDRYSTEYDYHTQIAYFTKMLNYSKKGNNPFIEMLFCDVASHFLMLEFSTQENMRNGKGITLFHIPLAMTAGVKKYRELVWNQLLELSSKETFSLKIKDILRKYGNSIHDCSKEVIVSDAEYINSLSQMLLSPDRLTDCLIAQSLQNVFTEVGYYPEWLELFNKSAKYELYQNICGPKWNSDISFEEYKKKKEDSIRKYFLTTTNKTAGMQEIINLFVESTNIENCDSHEIAEGINISMEILADDKDTYVKCVSLILSSEVITGINLRHIVETLFSISSPNEILTLLNKSCQNNWNEWLFAYYYAIPESLINHHELDGLYKFLMDESDCDIQSAQFRDINFLDKYIPIDENVIIRASEIILKKKEYSSFMVHVYFALQFNEHYIHPKNVIQKYRRDIDLLEQIYLCVIEKDNIADYRGSFLHAMFESDKSLVRKYAKWFVLHIENDSFREHESIVEVFFQEEDYLDILDYIVNEATTSLNFQSITVPRIIKLLLSPLNDKNEKNFEKKDCWIKHYIESNYIDKDKMRSLFGALTEISLKRTRDYIDLLVHCTEDYDIFVAIPLTPPSYSWSGSIVPIYSSWIEHLGKLLPIFSGLKYIKHKDMVLQLIDYYKNKIKEEEISDILNG